MTDRVNEQIKQFKERYSDEFYNSLMAYEKIIFIGKENNGYVTSKNISEKGISREYIRLLEKKGAIDKVSRGIYVLKDVIPDDFYIFQLRYPKTIFSHFTALYFYNLTEEFPYKFDITCSRSYNVEAIKDNNIFYVDNTMLKLGMVQVKTKYGNIVNTYDIERTVCDIIRNNNRMDEEQILKCMKIIFVSKKVDITKLVQYSKKLKCYDKVVNYVRYFDE